MSSEAAPATPPGLDFAAANGRTDGWWPRFVGSIDAALRAYYGICDYTDDPACVFRVGRAAARRAITLSDGTHVAAGEPVGMLHFWNEHLPRYTASGPDFAWAATMRRRLFRSLQLLADFIAREPDWRDIQAVCGDATLSRRLGTTQIRRVGRHLGLEIVAVPLSGLAQVHFLGDCFNAWVLTSAFNPAALERQGFLRGRCEVWISRRTLFARHGRRARHGAPRP